MKCIILIVFLVLTLPLTTMASTAYVNSDSAAVYIKPAMNSAKATQLTKGDKVDVIREKGSWSQIDYGKGKGFVYSFLLNKKPVATSDKLYSRLRSFFSQIESISSKSRRRPSSYTATAAARGFREKREHFAEMYKSDYDSLEKFESITISNDEALNFIQKGVADEKNN